MLDGNLHGRDGAREEVVKVEIALAEEDKAGEVAAVDVVTGLIISSCDGGAMAYSEA